MSLSQKTYRTVSLCCFASLLVVASASVVTAQDGGATGDITGGASILNNAIEVSKKSEAGLTELWDFTFTGNYSPAYTAVVTFARQLAVIPFFWLFIPMTQAFIFNRYEEIFKHIAWLMVVLMLSVNSFGLTANLVHGTRGWMNATTLSILETQVGAVTMKDALNDVLLTEQAKAIIQEDFAECEAKEGEEQIQCFNDGAEAALKDIGDAEDAQFLPGLNGLRKRLEGVRDNEFQLSDLNPLADIQKVIFVSAGQALAQQLMKAFQNAMLTMMDVGFFLTALLGPVAVVASLAPITPRILFIWATAILSFGMKRMAYNILVGAIATVALFGDTTDLGSTGLLIGMAVFSPLLAMAMAGWGGAKIRLCIESEPFCPLRLRARLPQGSEA